MVKTYPCFYSTDVEPPRFLNCPSRQTVYAQKGKTTATVSWALVKATDNDMFPITPQPRPNVKSTHEFYFLMKVARATVLLAGGNPQPPPLNDSPVT